jgi:hypothetical protein
MCVNLAPDHRWLQVLTRWAECRTVAKISQVKFAAALMIAAVAVIPWNRTIHQTRKIRLQVTGCAACLWQQLAVRVVIEQRLPAPLRW